MQQMETTVFEVDGMTCGGCEQGIVRVLAALPGVEAVRASHVDRRVEVDGIAESTLVASAIVDAGYEVVSGPTSA